MHASFGENGVIFSFITGWLEGITHYVFFSQYNGLIIHRAVPQPLPDWPGLHLASFFPTDSLRINHRLLELSCLNGIWNYYRGRGNQIGVFKRAESWNHTHIIIIITAWKSMQSYSKCSSPNPLNVKPENGILAWLLWTEFTVLQCRAVYYSWVVSHVSLALDLNLNPEALTLIEAGRAPPGTAAKLIQTTATPSWCSASPSLPHRTQLQRTGLRRWAVCAVYSMSLEDQNNILKFM